MHGILIGLDSGHVPVLFVFVESDTWNCKNFPENQVRIYNVRKFERSPQRFKKKF